MGLRERNALRTREMIIDTALSLFLERGYDATKMEDIAEAAGIGTSTLYRYFATKDLLIIEPLAFRGKFVESLRARPAAEPLAIALGHVLTELFTTPRAEAARLWRIQEVVADNPAPRMRLLEEFVNERLLLERAIAERLGRPEQDLYCYMTARTTFDLIEYIGALSFQRREELDEGQIRDVFGALTRQLAAEPPAIPVLTDPPVTDP